MPALPARSQYTRSFGWQSQLQTEEFKMIPNALLLTIAILIAYGFWLLDQLKFMAPYKSVLIHSYGTTLLVCVGLLFFNVFGAALLLQRKFFLKDTGRKLSHLDRQFQVRQVEMPVPEEDPGASPRCLVVPIPIDPHEDRSAARGGTKNALPLLIPHRNSRHSQQREIAADHPSVPQTVR